MIFLSSQSLINTIDRNSMTPDLNMNLVLRMCETEALCSLLSQKQE